MKRKSRVRLLPVLIGLLLIPVFVSRVGVSAIARELQRLGPESLLILLPYAAGTALAAFPWAWLLGARLRPRRSATIASRFAASGANALLPFFGFAGEPCRLFWLPSSARAAGLAAIVVDRLLYNAAGGLLLLIGAAATLTTRLSVAVSAAAAALAAVIVAISFVIVYVISRYGVGAGVQRILRRVLSSAYTQPELGARVDTAVRIILRGPRAPLWRGLLVHFVARVLLGVEVYVALWSLHAGMSVGEAIVLSTVPIATSVFASSIPSQIGVQEGAQAMVCAALGHPPALGLVLVLLQRLRQLVFVPLTPFLLVGAHPRSSVDSEASAHCAPD
jgi:hypothetical protein